jgi:hypothetical protein
VYQYQAYTKAAKQGNVIDQVMEAVILDGFTAK